MVEKAIRNSRKGTKANEFTRGRIYGMVAERGKVLDILVCDSK